MNLSFRKWLVEHATRPGAKQSLYPLSYGGIGLYTPPDYMNWAADAVTYLPQQNRFLKFIWGDGFLGNPFEKETAYTSVEGKTAPQIEVGTLKASGDRFEKSPNYVRVIREKGKEQEIASRGELTIPGTDIDAA